MWHNHQSTEGYQQESQYTPPIGPPQSYPPASTCGGEEHQAPASVPWPPGARKPSPPGNTGQASMPAAGISTRCRPPPRHEPDKHPRHHTPRESEEAAKQKNQ
ncbi:hypothetical protein JCGZ_04225 [Jatropha curcas]|uniref:Uncharacterized protein n=1 Tax=Jatropha curcas TaxID=180498 RepID=A0A067JCV1_JATCU|nr:hypothetical protein JCGZ_04225 [Jatropha curcas]